MPHHTDTHAPAKQPLRKRQSILIPVLVIVAGALFAAVVWMLPNWNTFAQNVAHFPTLWQVESNRRAILILVVKVTSPLLVALILAACCWLYATIRPLLSEEGETEESGQAHPAATRGTWSPPQTPPPGTFAMRPITSAKQPDARRDVPTALPVRPLQTSRDAVPPVSPTLPVTPLPPTLLPAQGSLNGTASINETGFQTVVQREELASGLGPLSPASQPVNSNAATGTPAFSSSPRHQIDLEQEAPQEGDAQSEYVRITLLKEVGMEIVAPNGMRAVVPLTLNAKRVQLLAYIAWLRGEKVNRDKMLEDVFGHGLPDEEATPKRLGDAFDSHRKLLRRDLRETIAHLNEEAGTELIPPDLDIFSVRQKLWGLASTCRVTDLEAVEAQHQIIEAARRDGRLVNDVPEEVKSACDALLKAYTGDFLENLIRDYIDDFDPWTSSWARKPFTLYRDMYLQALWYSAEYELRRGQQLAEGPLDENSAEGAAVRRRQREHYGRAAQQYYKYAMYAVGNRFDTKLTFGKPGREHGERIIMSERALRRTLMLYGIVGSTHLVDQVYSAYYKHMKRISSDQWNPSKETLKDLEQAKSRTSAYRLPTQVTPHEPLPYRETADRSIN